MNRGGTEVRSSSAWGWVGSNILVFSNTYTTVPTFNSCTKCMGSLGIIHDLMPNCHPVSWSRMHGWPHKWTLFIIRKLLGSLMCLAYYFDMFFVDKCAFRHWKTSGLYCKFGVFESKYCFYCVFLFYLYCVIQLVKFYDIKQYLCPLVAVCYFYGLM